MARLHEALLVELRRAGLLNKDDCAIDGRALPKTNPAESTAMQARRMDVRLPAEERQ